MSYFLGIDLGTTYTAAAIWRDGRAEIVGLGTRAQVIPSVVLLREDGEILTGEAAARRAVVEPQNIAREFKRRVGDPTPLYVGGEPYPADMLTARLLRSVVDTVVDQQRGRPTGIGISHPANWGGYKVSLLRQAIEMADLGPVQLISEPEAAAIHYASQARVEVGAVVAVYDLGGGTFDAAVLRRTHAGWDTLGYPEGIERLGGVDFDEAVFQHVVSSIGAPYECLDPDDPATLAAVTRLRHECIDAKEALATDTDVTIPVLLPTVHTEVRLTRTEFEDMIRPALGDSIAGLHRALRSAGVMAGEITAVLLVGGSSRIPLVAQLVASAFVRPVAVDAHPKHSVALGAAIIAADQVTPGAVNTSEVDAPEDVMPAATVWTAPTSSRPLDPTTVRTVTPQETAAVRTPSLPGLDDEDQQRRRRAFGLVLTGVAALVVALVGVLALGRDRDPRRVTRNPAGVPANMLPEGPASEIRQPGSAESPDDPTPSSTEVETTTSVDINGLTTTTTSIRSSTTTTTEEPTTTTSETTTTTEEPTTTTSEPSTTSTTAGPPEG